MNEVSKSRIVAVEEHFVTDDYYEHAKNLEIFAGEEPERAFITNFEKTELLGRFTDVETRIGEMDQAGIDLAVLSLNSPGVQMFSDAAKATTMAREANDRLVEFIQKHPGRFAGLGSLAPQEPEQAAREIKRVMGTLKLGGILINSHTNGRYLDEPECEPILAALEEEDATLYLHPRCPSAQMIKPFTKYGMVGAVWGFQADAGTHAVRLITSGVFDRHPRLRVVLGHLGEALPFFMWRLDNIFEKTFGWAGDALKMVKLDRKPSEYIRDNFYLTTSGMADPDVLEYCVGKVGPERIMFSVDYPYEDCRVFADALNQARIEPDQRELIAHSNAESLFRIQAAS